MGENGLFQELAFDITMIDCLLYRPGIAACYLVGAEGEYALIDCGTRNAVPRILNVLQQKAISVEQVKYVVPTHVHLDHAGGAGELIACLPNSKLLIHPRGLRHMLNPKKLQAGTVAVYGEAEFERIFGSLTPIPEDRAQIAEDGYEINLNGRILKCFDTPGHARHHLCIYDKLSQGFFTGDTFGLSYRHLDSPQGALILPTTTPVNFDPDAWQASLNTLMSCSPQRMYLTHFGVLENVKQMAGELRRDLNSYVEIADNLFSSKNRVKELQELLMQHALEKLKKLENQLEENKQRAWLNMDMGLNAQGLNHWLTVRGKEKN